MFLPIIRIPETDPAIKERLDTYCLFRPRVADLLWWCAAPHKHTTRESAVNCMLERIGR